MIDLGGLSRREMLWFVVYKISHRSSLPLKVFFIVGQWENKKEKEEENMESREKQGYSSNLALGE